MMRAKLSTCALLLAVSSALHAASLPSSGMSMQAVESQFGQPLKKNAAIGQPPITRWEYDGFVVVFERSTVVASVNVSRAGAAVAAKAPATAPAPAPVKKAAPVIAPAPAPAPAVAAPAAPAPDSAPAPAPATTPAPAAAPETATAPAQDPMSKAAAEKAAEGTAPATATPADSGYSFDPETGRFIIK
jgi:hypothetical protein